jgi:hypothetical protein
LSRAERERAGTAASGRATNMFATREDYQMTEEELIDYERQEEAETQRRKKLKKNPNSGF